MEDNKNVLYNNKDVKKNKAKAFFRNKIKTALSPRFCMGSIAVALIVALAAGSVLLPDKKFSDKENRNLAQRPAFSFTALKSGEYTSDMNTYIADQFPLRNMWIKLRARCEMTLGHYFINGVYRGDDDFLFEDITVQDSKSLVGRLSALNNFAETVNTVPSYMMVVPTSASVMSDCLPENTPIADQNAYLDYLYSGLSTKIHKIDVRETFKQKYSEGEQLYYRTDHHWTTDGAYEAFKYASQELGFDPSKAKFKEYPVTDKFSGTLESKSGFNVKDDIINVFVPQDESDVTYLVENVSSSKKSASVFDPDKLETSDKYAVFFGGNQALVKISTRAKADRRFLVIQDSYAHCFLPFLFEDASEIDVVDLRYYNQKLSDLIAEGNYTDVLFLYNVAGFAEDTSLAKLLG